MLASHLRQITTNVAVGRKGLRLNRQPCYGQALRGPSDSQSSPVSLSNRKVDFCREHFSNNLLILCLALILTAGSALAQTPAHPAKADLPPEDEIWYHAVTQESDENMYHLRGSAVIELSDVSISADTIDFNSDTNEVIARGHVHLRHFASGDNLEADHGEYNLKTQEGKFYDVRGTSPAKIITSPGILTTANPFYFQAQWADRIKDRYILHHGYLTDCKIPKPWWTFEAPVFDVIPGDRAIARHTIFKLKGVPIFYLPYFYRPLGKNPRHSGFLTPEVGHSSRYGWVYGAGYYWAINSSFDMTTIVQDYTTRGPVVRYDFRGKPNEATDFNFYLYGVEDKGISGYNAEGVYGANAVKQGGLEFELTARTEILGFTGVLDYNYLSSLTFREIFSPAFSYPLWSQNDSVGYLQRHFKDDTYTVDIALERQQLFEAATLLGAVPNQVIIQKLPSVDFLGRDQDIGPAKLPIWFSFDTNAGLMSREEPTGANTLTPATCPTSSATSQALCPIFQTGQVSRVDIEPRVSTEFSFKGFSLVPSLNLGATDYGNSYSTNTTVYTPSPVSSCNGYLSCSPNSTTSVALSGSNLFRKDADFILDFRPPSIERVFIPPQWLHLGAGTKLKHVVEAEATYEYVTGVNEFQKIIHFDSTDIISNTNQLTMSLTNRLYRKDKNGHVAEIVTWRLAQARYFDPTFGGVVTANQGACAANPDVAKPASNPYCQRVVVLATEELTPIAFLDGPRNYSPIVSTLTLSPYSFFSMDWRTDYDPLRHKFLDQSVSASVRHKTYFFNISDTSINTNPLLDPQANQIGLGGGYGSTNRKGWNAAANVTYDLLLDRRLLDFIQASYNTDCCGFSFQLRNFNLGLRNDNQYLFSFSVANIGAFGSLPKQARIF